jgi:phosphatidylglycerophosphate synthase
MRTHVLLAYAADPAGGPACEAWLGADESVIARVVHQCLAIGGDVLVCTRTAWTDRLRMLLPAGTEIIACDTVDVLATHLLTVSDGQLMIVDAEIATHGWAITSLVRHPASASAALVTSAERVPQAPLARVTRGRLAAAASAHHQIVRGDHRTLGMLRVTAADRPAFAEMLHALTDSSVDWEPEALTGVLIVGLVRTGVPVVPVQLRGLHWSRVTGAESAATAAAELAAVDEEQVRLDAAVKSDDGFFTTFLVSPYSRYLARWAARRGFTPNQVTVASMALGVAAAAAFAAGTRGWAIVGAVLLQAAFTLDCVDGQLARYLAQYSAAGAWLDSVFDRGKEYVVLAGLAYGGTRVGQDGAWLLAAVALTVQTFRHVLDFGYAEQQGDDLTVPEQHLEEIDEAGLNFWEADPLAEAATSSDAAPAASSGVRTLARGSVSALRRAEGRSALRWAKRIVVLPIGERFALLSVLAATTSPRTTLLGLTVWSTLAMAYTFLGRVLRSVT